jgi:tetratricopeptide (TPR) repeat protein
MRRFLIAIVAAVLTVVASDADAARGGAQDVDYLSLAEILAADGNFERAEIMLEQVDTEDEDLDQARFRYVRGYVRLNRGLYVQAVEDFQASIALATERKEKDEEAEGPSPVVYILLGQASFFAQDYEGALAALDQAGEKANESPKNFLLRAEAAWKLERHDEAWEYLNQGGLRFPDFNKFLERKVLYATRLKLYQRAAELGADYVRKTNATADQYIAIGKSLAESGSPESALPFLEVGRLKSPEHSTATLELARVYANVAQPRSAASLLEREAFHGHPELFLDAAGYYLKAGELFRALSLTRYIANSTDRLRQRLAILVQMQNWESIALMERDLARVGLLEDESLRYAVAYAHFKTSNFRASERLLAGLRDPGLFRKAAVLRQSMQRCSNERWKC